MVLVRAPLGLRRCGRRRRLGLRRYVGLPALDLGATGRGPVPPHGPAEPEQRRRNRKVLGQTLSDHVTDKSTHYYVDHCITFYNVGTVPNANNCFATRHDE